MLMRFCRGPEHNPSAQDAHRAGDAAPRYIFHYLSFKLIPQNYIISAYIQ